MGDERKHHAPEEKVAILQRHLFDKVPVSTLRDEHQPHPTVFYRWLKQFLENLVAAFWPAPRAALRLITLAQLIAEFHSAPTGRRMTLECGGSTPPWNGVADQKERGRSLRRVLREAKGKGDSFAVALQRRRQAAARIMKGCPGWVRVVRAESNET